MTDDAKEIVADLLELSESELLLEIGLAARQGAGLTSPDELERRATSLVDELKPELAATCCKLLRSFSGPELDLAHAIVSVLVAQHGYLLAAALGAYLVKRGAAWLCAEPKDD